MNLIVALDSIRSTHNVGSLFRTADSCGVHRMILGGITPGPIDRFGRWRTDIAKVALGAERVVEYESVTNLLEYLLAQQQNGIRVVVLEQHERSQSLFTYHCPAVSEIIVVVGNEVGGVSPEILEIADDILEIPHVGTKESLNVSVAAGIALYHIAHLSGTL